jgi:hypothetical protein
MKTESNRDEIESSRDVYLKKLQDREKKGKRPY